MKKRKNVGETVFGLYRSAVTVFFAVILIFLLFFAAFSTCYMVTDWTERTFFVKDSVLLNLCFIPVMVLGMTVLRRIKAVQIWLDRMEKEEILFRKWKRILLGILMGMALVWVLASRCGVQGDQEYIQNAVYDLNTRNYLMFSEGGYLYRFAQQRGLTAAVWLFSLIFGSYNYIAFQVLNVIGIGVFYHQMSEICGLFGMGRVVRLKVILYGILFFPLIMYCSFVYGNVWGMALALSALKYEIRFLEDRKARGAVISALLIMLALLLKSNYMIFLIGMAVLALVETLRKKEVKFLLLPLLAVALCTAQGRVVNGIFQEVSGESFGQEASKWSWIAMGLQEGIRAPGWYNDFVWYTYDESGYDTEIHDEMVKAEIQESLEYFAGHKDEAVEFFTRKMVSQWNNPTFQAFWNAQVAPGEGVRSNWVWHFISARGTHISTAFLNLFQFFILAGALIWCVVCRKEPHYEKALPFAMIFVGGTLCHLVWEAKGQYTLAYFVLLFPYAAAGYGRLTDCLAAAGRGEALRQTVVFTKGMAAVAAAALAGVVLLWEGGCLDYLTQDTDAYYQYLEEQDTAPELADGVYHIFTRGGLVLGCGEGEGGSPVLDGKEDGSGGEEIQVVNYQETTWLYFVQNQYYISGSDITVPEGWAAAAGPSERKEEERWTIRKAGNGGFYILYDKYFALSYGEETGSVYLELLSEEKENQIWYAERVE